MINYRVEIEMTISDPEHLRENADGGLAPFAGGVISQHTNDGDQCVLIENYLAQDEDEPSLIVWRFMCAIKAQQQLDDKALKAGLQNCPGLLEYADEIEVKVALPQQTFHSAPGKKTPGKGLQSLASGKKQLAWINSIEPKTAEMLDIARLKSLSQMAFDTPITSQQSKFARKTLANMNPDLLQKAKQKGLLDEKETILFLVKADTDFVKSAMLSSLLLRKEISDGYESLKNHQDKLSQKTAQNSLKNFETHFVPLFDENFKNWLYGDTFMNNHETLLAYFQNLQNHNMIIQNLNDPEIRVWNKKLAEGKDSPLQKALGVVNQYFGKHASVPDLCVIGDKTWNRIIDNDDDHYASHVSKYNITLVSLRAAQEIMKVHQQGGVNGALVHEMVHRHQPLADEKDYQLNRDAYSIQLMEACTESTARNIMKKVDDNHTSDIYENVVNILHATLSLKLEPKKMEKWIARTHRHSKKTRNAVFHRVLFGEDHALVPMDFSEVVFNNLVLFCADHPGYTQKALQQQTFSLLEQAKQAVPQKV